MCYSVLKFFRRYGSQLSALDEPDLAPTCHKGNSAWSCTVLSLVHQFSFIIVFEHHGIDNRCSSLLLGKTHKPKFLQFYYIRTGKSTKSFIANKFIYAKPTGFLTF